MLGARFRPGDLTDTSMGTGGRYDYKGRYHKDYKVCIVMYSEPVYVTYYRASDRKVVCTECSYKLTFFRNVYEGGCQKVCKLKIVMPPPCMLMGGCIYGGHCLIICYV